MIQQGPQHSHFCVAFFFFHVPHSQRFASIIHLNETKLAQPKDHHPQNSRACIYVPRFSLEYLFGLLLSVTLPQVRRVLLLFLALLGCLNQEVGSGRDMERAWRK
jgi:hypothetical protein